uniref:Uncharacterized protein n=1 Tax=Arundo donax TaxID=35708 RepID=A0A0A9I1B3_ARUDO
MNENILHATMFNIVCQFFLNLYIYSWKVLLFDCKLKKGSDLLVLYFVFRGRAFFIF